MKWPEARNPHCNASPIATIADLGARGYVHTLHAVADLISDTEQMANRLPLPLKPVPVPVKTAARQRDQAPKIVA